jgi:hypothetical protein
MLRVGSVSVWVQWQWLREPSPFQLEEIHLANNLPLYLSNQESALIGDWEASNRPTPPVKTRDLLRRISISWLAAARVANDGIRRIGSAEH